MGRVLWYFFDIIWHCSFHVTIRFTFVITMPGQDCQMWLPKVKYPQANSVSTKFNYCLSTDLKWKLHWVILFKRCWIITAYTEITRCLSGQYFWKPGHIFESPIMNSETKFRHICWKTVDVHKYIYRFQTTLLDRW